MENYVKSAAVRNVLTSIPPQEMILGSVSTKSVETRDDVVSVIKFFRVCVIVAWMYVWKEEESENVTVQLFFSLYKLYGVRIDVHHSTTITMTARVIYSTND